MSVCRFVTSSTLNDLSDRKTDYTTKIGLKEHLFNGVLSNTCTNSNSLFLLYFNVRTDNHVVCVDLGITDTEKKQICKFANVSSALNKYHSFLYRIILKITFTNIISRLFTTNLQLVRNSKNMISLLNLRKYNISKQNFFFISLI